MRQSLELNEDSFLFKVTEEIKKIHSHKVAQDLNEGKDKLENEEKVARVAESVLQAIQDVIKDLPDGMLLLQQVEQVAGVEETELYRDISTEGTLSFNRPFVSVLKEPVGVYKNGCHVYKLEESSGYNEKEKRADLLGTFQTITFLKKDPEGGYHNGILSEALLLVLKDRHFNLNNAYKSSYGGMFNESINLALLSQNLRYSARVKKGIMGKHIADAKS